MEAMTPAAEKLLIVESPAKAKTIGKYLDREYRVLASVGHIRDLPKSDRNAIDIAAGFVPHYEIVKGKERIVAELTQAAGRAAGRWPARRGPPWPVSSWRPRDSP